MADKSSKNTEPVLDLNTLVERSTIRIDGKLYELKNAGELSLLDYQRVVRCGVEIRDKLKRDEDAELSDAEVTAGSKSLDSLCRLILVAPTEVHDRLQDGHRIAIMKVFTGLQRPAAPAQTEETVAAAHDGKTSTGASKSRGSRASTAVRP